MQHSPFLWPVDLCDCAFVLTGFGVVFILDDSNYLWLISEFMLAVSLHRLYIKKMNSVQAAVSTLITSVRCLYVGM